MRRRLSVIAFVVAVLGALAPGCGDNIKARGTPDAGMPPDAGGPGVVEVQCATLPATATGDVCEVSPGGDSKLIKGIVLTPTTVYRGGQVAVDPAGKITCVGCDCAAGGETVISCPDGAVSPGLINTHDHITYTQNAPALDNGVRYEHRHQWRLGATGRPKIPSPGGANGDQQAWGELRFVMGGATSIVGSGGQRGLLRNLDKSFQEGLGEKPVNFDVFPLGDSGGARRTGDCNYNATGTTEASIADDDAYEPHTSEGIDATARNEFLCESSSTYDAMAPGVSRNLLQPKTAMIHAIGLQPVDLGAMAVAGTGLIWSPRSNISLYGDTARVTTAARLGVEIAIGTDWTLSGSMNLLRELRCADELNTTYYDKYFTDQQLWSMATNNAASVVAMDDKIGVLAKDRFADIAVFDAKGGKSFRAVLDAEPKDVALVMRAGKVLYGDDAAVSALATGCDAIDVCTTAKRACLTSEVGKSYADLKTGAGASTYYAFACGVPENEPTCVPERPQSVDGSTIYTGLVTAGDADGDGIADSEDKCPAMFSPIRPVDMGMQADADGDSLGDVCDPCPLDANTRTCSTVDPNDRDADGEPNSTDNCPDISNPDQADVDDDGRGDLCDPCPSESNPGSAGCPATIYEVKNGTAAIGKPVRITNALVTAKGTNGFFVQAKDGDTGYAGVDYSGLFVFTGADSPLLAAATIGMRVTVDGSVANFLGQLELDAVVAVTPTTTVVEPAPAPVAVAYTDIVTGGPRAATLEGVIVTVGVGSVTAIDAMNKEFTLTAGAASLVVDDFAFGALPLPPIGQAYNAVTGVLALRQMASKLGPRSLTDLVEGPPRLSTLTPALSFARVGTTTNAPTFPQPLTITLTGPAQGATEVVLTSSDDTKLTVANVTIANGATSIVVPVTAVAAAADVTVTATLGTQVLTAHVRVLTAGEGPIKATLTPAVAAVAPGGTLTMSVVLDAPALAAGTVVDLAQMPASGTLPPTVTVPAGQIAATFDYVDTTGAGTTLSATLLGTTTTAMVSVLTGPNHLVINEIDYDQTGTDAAEFIEIYNPTPLPIDLSGLQVILINGNNGGASIYTTIDLPEEALASEGYLVVAVEGVVVPASAIKVILPPASGGSIQNGAPDGVALIDNVEHTVIDVLAYEGPISGVQPTGFSTSFSLVEGAGAMVSDADADVAKSMCRFPNGQDTDHAETDWALCAVPSPGVAN